MDSPKVLLTNLRDMIDCNQVLDTLDRYALSCLGQGMITNLDFS